MPKTEKTIDGFAVRTGTGGVGKAGASSASRKLSSASKKHTPSNLKKTARKKPATPSRSLSGIKSSNSAKKSKQPALAPKKKPATPLAEVQSTSTASEDFLAPVKPFDTPVSSDTSLESASNLDNFAEDASSQDSYIDSLSHPDSAFSEGSASELDMAATEAEDSDISELTPEEVRAMRKKSKQSTALSKADLKAAEKRAKAEEKAEKKRNKKKSPVKTALKIFFLLLLLALIGGGVYVVLHLSDIISRITGGNDDIWSAGSALLKETYDPLKTDASGRTNILVFGTSGYDMAGDVGDGYSHDGADLTDSIMVVSIDQDKGDIAMVSLPRDLKAGYTCTATGKINEVYWCANPNGDNEAAGATALQSKVSEILGVDTQYYIHLNWGSLVSIVNALGGITVTLDEDIADYGWTDAVYSAGVAYDLDGEDALALARARHGTENGDFTRGNSQQKILIAIKEKVVEKGLDFSAVTNILNTLGDDLRSNLSVSDIKTGMHLLEVSDLSSIRQVPLVSDDAMYMSTATINGISYVIPSAGVDNYLALKEYVKEMFTADPLQREAAKLLVLNGSGESGVASAERAKLEAEGFRVQEIGDAPDSDYSSLTLYDTSEGKKPTTLTALEKYYNLEAEPEENLPAGVSGYGYDFIIIVGQKESSEDVQTE